jgi:predicted RNase H-like HicB family nuclease
MKLHIHLEKDKKGYYVAEVPSLPGCFSQGTTRKKALRNIREAVMDWLEVMDSKSEFRKRDLITIKI